MSHYHIPTPHPIVRQEAQLYQLDLPPFPLSELNFSESSSIGHILRNRKSDSFSGQIHHLYSSPWPQGFESLRITKTVTIHWPWKLALHLINLHMNLMAADAEHLLQRPLPICLSLGEMLILVLLQPLPCCKEDNWIISFLLIGFSEFFIYSRYQTLERWLEIFSPILEVV